MINEVIELKTTCQVIHMIYPYFTWYVEVPCDSEQGYWHEKGNFLMVALCLTWEFTLLIFAVDCTKYPLRYSSQSVPQSQVQC